MLHVMKLAETIGNVALINIDPVVLTIARTGDGNSNSNVRQGLQPLLDIAARVNACILGVDHFSKGTQGKDPLERIRGSLAYGATARTAMAAVKSRDKDAEAPRMLLRAKNNNGLDGGGFGYDLELGPVRGWKLPYTRIKWLGEIEGSAREHLNAAEQVGESRSKIRDWILAFLKGGPKTGEETLAALMAEGIGSQRSLFH
jgi:putative DNA primase/helicase